MSERDAVVPNDPFADHTGELRRLREELADRYRLQRELGGGGMSRVFVALDPSLGREVVIKVLHPGLAASLSMERFKREVSVVAGLQHPNIVPVLAAGEGGGLPYFIMPFIEGESLRERLIRGPLSVRETVSIMKDVARALAFAHDRGIVHRDIKPGNILVTAGAAVVTDFGIAKALNTALVSQPGRRGAPTPDSAPRPQTLTQLGTSLGTPAYMAPEQAAGDPATDHRADIYALGVVAWEMLVGTPPFHGRSPQALLTAQLSETPPAISTRRYDVPMPLHALIMRCLEKSADLRPRTATELLRHLEDPELLSGAYATPPSVTRRSDRRRRELLAFGGAFAVLAAGVIGWEMSRGRAADPPAPAPLLVTPAPPTLGRALAVLPLTALGRDEQTTTIAEGVTSEVTTQVAGIPRLRVTSGTAVATLRDRRAAPAEIARLLNVTMLVEGTVQREGAKVRVSLRLVSAQNDSTIWSDTFDGESGASLALQDRVAKSLVAAIAPRLSSP